MKSGRRQKREKKDGKEKSEKEKRRREECCEGTKKERRISWGGKRDIPKKKLGREWRENEGESVGRE